MVLWCKRVEDTMSNQERPNDPEGFIHQGWDTLPDEEIVQATLSALHADSDPALRATLEEEVRGTLAFAKESHLGSSEFLGRLRRLSA